MVQQKFWKNHCRGARRIELKKLVQNNFGLNPEHFEKIISFLPFGWTMATLKKKKQDARRSGLKKLFQISIGLNSECF